MYEAGYNKFPVSGSILTKIRQSIKLKFNRCQSACRTGAGPRGPCPMGKGRRKTSCHALGLKGSARCPNCVEEKKKKCQRVGIQLVQRLARALFARRELNTRRAAAAAPNAVGGEEEAGRKRAVPRTQPAAARFLPSTAAPTPRSRKPESHLSMQSSRRCETTTSS